MYRLTTPTHQFNVVMDPREWEKFVISYSQCDKIILEKTEQDNVEIVAQSEEGPFALKVKLSQEETQLFSSKDIAYDRQR